MLEKQTIVDKIEVLENLHVQVRTAVKIIENGSVISTSYHRHVLEPGADLTTQDIKVATICNAIWPQPVTEQ